MPKDMLPHSLPSCPTRCTLAAPNQPRLPPHGTAPQYPTPCPTPPSPAPMQEGEQSLAPSLGGAGSAPPAPGQGLQGPGGL